LKASSRLASLRVVVRSQESMAVLTSEMIWAVVSGKLTPLPGHALSRADTPIWNSFPCASQMVDPEDSPSAWMKVKVLKLQPHLLVWNTVETSVFGV